MDLNKISAFDLRDKIVNGEIKAREVVENYLEKIKETNEDLNTFITIDEEAALIKAEEIDEKVKNKEKLGSLAGIPIGIKDNISTKNLRTTCGSKALENYIPPFDATLVDIIRQEDGIIVGKNNLDEFAVGSSTETSFVGPTRNPIDTNKVAGGSSGGSSAAIKAGQVLLSVGTDTGGSVRQPAAFCGVVGIKPSYGMISRYGLVSMGNSMDQAGVFGRDVRDAGLFLKSLMAYDEKDSTSYKNSIEALKDMDFSNKDIRGMRVGIPKTFMESEMEEEIRRDFEESIKTFKELGAIVEEVEMPYLKYSRACYYALVTAELSSNLARFDGIIYGYRAEDYEDLDDLYLNTRSQSLSFEVKRRVAFGNYILTGENREKYYEKALKVRRLIKEDFDRVFKDYDILISPTTITLPYPIGGKINNTEKMYDGDGFTIPANLAGICAMSLPSGEAKGLPMGLQIFANKYDEEKMIRAGLAFEGGRDNGI